jgi:hypothetical protein
MSDVERVAAAAARDAGLPDGELLGGYLATVVAAAATGRRLRRGELRACTEAGREAAEQGVALRALVDLYLSAAWRLWRDVPEVAGGGADRVREAALSVLRAADDGVAALAEGYQLARIDLARQLESSRHALLDALLAGGRVAVDAGATSDLGLPTSGPLAVLLATSPTGYGDPGTAALPSRVERALQGRHGDAHPLVLLREGVLTCVFAAPDPTSVQLVSEVVAAQVGALDAAGWRAAVSRPRPGAASVRAGHEEATEALELAVRLDLLEQVVDAGDLTVHRLLLRDRAAAHELVRAVLTPLAGARGGAEPLLATLEAWFATGCVATATAGRLHLSVRAVTYRLARVAQLTGHDPADPADRFTLQTATAVARLLGWPEVPLEG